MGYRESKGGCVLGETSRSWRDRVCMAQGTVYGRDVWVKHYCRGPELEQRTVTPFLNPEFPTNQPDHAYEALVVNSRQPGRTDQEDGWREAMSHTALIIRHLLGLLRMRVGERGWNELSESSHDLPGSSASAEHSPPPYPRPASSCWLRACLKLDTSPVSL